MKTPVIGVAGWKNSGKTTLVTKIIAELTARGLRVASVKHAHHEADVDREGSDSFRHRAAGAVEVALVTSARWALVHELRGDAEPSLDAILSRLSACDVVIVEGYKRESIPKIEVRRTGAAKADPLTREDSNIVAVAADHSTDGDGRSVFDLNDVVGICDFVVGLLGLRVPTGPARR